MAIYTVTNSNNSGVGSLRWAVAQANDNTGFDTIGFEVDLVNLESAIAITDSVDVNGDNVTIVQTGEDRLFNINDNSDALLDVSFNKVTFEGGRPAEFGGAIYTLENLTVNESVVKDNLTAKRGGGIYSEGAALTITNSLFENNTITEEFFTSSGGAFYIQDGTLNIENSTFKNNKSAIAIASIGGGQSSITNSKFDSNSGGAILLALEEVATIDQVEITNNSSSISGAGIGIEDDVQVTISNSVISGNQSNFAGGIFISDSQVEIINSSITDNFANEAGGGIDIVRAGSLTIRNSTISGNSAPIGSAIETYEYGSAFIVDTTITGNTGSQNQLEGSNIKFGGGNTGGILEPALVEEPSDNLFNGGKGKDTISGSLGDDVINGRGNNDNLTGEGGNDRIRGNEGSDLLFGNDGNDTLNGGLQFDRLYGGDGDDVLHGNHHSDTLEGGAGNDLFYLQGNVLGRDTILDFELDADRIGLDNGLDYNSLNISGVANTYIRQDGRLYAILLDVRPEDITADHFKQF